PTGVAPAYAVPRRQAESPAGVVLVDVLRVRLGTRRVVGRGTDGPRTNDRLHARAHRDPEGEIADVAVVQRVVVPQVADRSGEAGERLAPLDDHLSRIGLQGRRLL